MVLEKVFPDVNEKSGSDKKPVGSPWFLYFSALTANLLFFTTGTIIGWTSPVLVKLLSNNTEVNPLGAPITSLQTSAIAALPAVFAAVGLAMMAKVSKTIGRKKSMLLCSISFIIAFNILAFSQHIYIYYICLSITGIINGGNGLNAGLYNAEIADGSNRGKLGCLAILFIPCGTLYGYTIGSMTSVKCFTSICTLPAILHVLLSIMINESPVYLASKGKKEDALISLEKLRGHQHYSKLELEYQEIEEYIRNDAIGKKRNFLDLLKTKATRKAFFLTLLIGVSSQACGQPVLMAFVGPMFNEIKANLSGDMMGIIQGSVTICMNLVATLLVDKLGRRPLMLASSFTCSAMMLCLGFYFYLYEVNYNLIQPVKWLPVLFVILFIVGNGIGVGCMTVLFVNEFFPHDLKETGIVTNFMGDAVAAFLVLLTFPLLSLTCGIYSALWIYSLASFIEFVLVFLYLPETKCKTFLEIQKMLSK